MTTATAAKNKRKRKINSEKEQERQARLDQAGRLVPSIKEAHEAVQEALESGLTHAIKTGEHLAAARKLVGHGGWAEWVKKNCAFSDRTARNYLLVYKHRDKLPKRADYSYRRAILMLRRDPAKKPGKNKSGRVVRTIEFADLKKLATKHKIKADVDALRLLLEELGIKVTSPQT